MKMTLLLLVKRLKLIPYSIGWLLVVGGVVILLLQASHWLDEKIWYSYSLYTIADYVIRWLSSFSPDKLRPGFYQWFYQPDRLVGLHAILIWLLNFIPTSIFLIVVGGYLESIMSNQRKILEDKINKDLATDLGFDDPTLVEFPDGIGLCVCSGRLLYENYYRLRFSIIKVTNDSLSADMEVDVEGERYGNFTKKFEVTIPRIPNKVGQLCPSLEIKSKIFPPLFIACIMPSTYVVGPLKEWRNSEREEVG